MPQFNTKPESEVTEDSVLRKIQDTIHEVMPVERFRIYEEPKSIPHAA